MRTEKKKKESKVPLRDKIYITNGTTHRSTCPHCQHKKAFLGVPRTCSRCGKVDKGMETYTNKHNKIRTRAKI